MKKIVIVLVCLILVGCGTTEVNDISKFKSEYEALNESSIQLEIDSEATVIYLDTKETVDFLENKTGIVYFGFPSCPWCRNMLPILLNVASSNNLPVYYYNSSNLQEDEQEDFSKVMGLIYEYLTENENGEKTLYVPDVYFVKDGQITGNHLGTVDSQSDPYIPLTDVQKEELTDIYISLVETIK